MVTGTGEAEGVVNMLGEGEGIADTRTKSRAKCD